jgi:CubicO group peptidase (beta-lactamase class C family)
MSWIVAVRLGSASILVGALAIVPSVLGAQTPGVDLPHTNAGRLLGEWLRLCESPAVDRMTQWLAANLSADATARRPAADRAPVLFAICTDNGGFRTAQVTKSDSASVTALVVGLRTDSWFEVSMTANGAGTLDQVGIRFTVPPESSLPTGLTDAALASHVQQIVAKLAGLGLFSGIVVVARDTQVIASASAGYANRAKHTLVTGSTQFTLGSLGKMFTAVAIGQLVDQHKVSFDDTVGRFFPDYPNHTVRDRVTVGMLLSHTAGMGDFLAKRSPEMMQRGVTRAAAFMPLYDHDEPQFAPGTQWAYSNAGLALAGAIVEKVSGEDYPEYVRRHVFTAAGMRHSDPNNIPHAGAELVTPYTRMTEHGPSSDWHEAEHDIGSPAGGAISTADDLVRFAAALRRGALLRKATFEDMASPHGTLPSGGTYGYGMEIEDTYGRRVVGHGGGFPGVSTHLYILLHAPYTVVVLANQDPPAEAYAGSLVLPLVVEKAKSVVRR